MTAKLSSDNVLYQSSLEHTNSTKTLIFVVTWHNTGIRDRRRSGRPSVTSRSQDKHIKLVHLGNKFQTWSLTARSIPGLRPISSRTVRNRLREHNIRPRRRAIRPILLLRHCAARLTLFKIPNTGLGQHPVYRWIPISPRVLELIGRNPGMLLAVRFDV
jgi:hypothetical protein